MDINIVIELIKEYGFIYYGSTTKLFRRRENYKLFYNNRTYEIIIEFFDLFPPTLKIIFPDKNKEFSYDFEKIDRINDCVKYIKKEFIYISRKKKIDKLLNKEIL